MSRAVLIAAAASALLLYGLSEFVSTVSTFLICGLAYLVSCGIIRTRARRSQRRT